MKIFSASNPTEAHIICGLLESENIACEVRGEDLFGLKGKSHSLRTLPPTYGYMSQNWPVKPARSLMTTRNSKILSFMKSGVVVNAMKSTKRNSVLAGNVALHHQSQDITNDTPP